MKRKEVAEDSLTANATSSDTIMAFIAWCSCIAFPMLLLSTQVFTYPLQYTFAKDFTVLLSGIQLALIPVVLLFLYGRYAGVAIHRTHLLWLSCFGAVAAHVSLSNTNPSMAEMLAKAIGQGSLGSLLFISATGFVVLRPHQLHQHATPTTVLHSDFLQIAKKRQWQLLVGGCILALCIQALFHIMLASWQQTVSARVLPADQLDDVFANVFAKMVLWCVTAAVVWLICLLTVLYRYYLLAMWLGIGLCAWSLTALQTVSQLLNVVFAEKKNAVFYVDSSVQLAITEQAIFSPLLWLSDPSIVFWAVMLFVVYQAQQVDKDRQVH